VSIDRDRCDYCRQPFEDGQIVYRYTMTGSMAEFEGVAGERIYLHGSCANTVTDVIRGPGSRHHDKVALVQALAIAIREES
jgi:hypothetical protein